MTGLFARRINDFLSDLGVFMVGRGVQVARVLYGFVGDDSVLVVRRSLLVRLGVNSLTDTIVLVVVRMGSRVGL